MSQKTKLLTCLICLMLAPLASATMQYQRWDTGVTGSRQAIIDFLVDLVNPVTLPDVEEILDESLYRGSADNYVAKAYGWLTVPATGDYQFHYACDDFGMLYVSPDEDMNNAVEVAWVDGWAGNAEWNKYPDTQHSDVMSLKKGQVLAIMAFYQEAGGGDNMDIGLTGPGLSSDITNPTYLTDYITHIPPVLSKARNPIPETEVDDVLRDTVLSWTPGEFSGTHNVYVGPSFEDVNSGTVPTTTGLDVNSFDPGRLEFGQAYYWRVDEVNASPDRTVHKGKIWSFTVEPHSIQIPGSEIVVTASSSSNEFSQPEKLVDGSGLGAGGTHDISPEAMWFTATVDLDPWIQFEFDAVKKLDTMTVWNSNGAAEAAIGWGVKDVVIEYSQDGENWAVLEGVNQFSRAPGLVTYDTADVIALNGVPAKYVRVDIESNWGGILMSYGLSEVQFNVIPAQARTPEPASGTTGVRVGETLAWRAGREAATHTVYIGTDANAVAAGTAPSVTTSTNSLDLGTVSLDMGETYYWRVDEVNNAEETTVWTGPVWNLTLTPSVVVDNFESYNNLSPDRPFQTWHDGFGYSADEFFPVGYGGNGTGVGIGHDIWTLTSPHYDGDIMEKSITINGSSQALPLYFDNSSGISQTDRTFATPQDWTLGGATVLSIALHGNPDLSAASTLYAKINNTKVTYDGDLSVPIWQAWHVDLAGLGINLTSVTTLSIGVEGSALGMILLDDIQLHKTAPAIPGPPAGGDKSLVAHWKFDETEGLDAADSSGYGNNGTLVGMDGTEWVAGHDGGAIEFSGSQYVDFGMNTSLQISGSVTISAWVKMNAGNDGAYMGIGGKLKTAPYRGFSLVRHSSGVFRLWADDGNGVIGGFDASSDVTYTDTEWHHVAGVVDAGTSMLYVDGVKQAKTSDVNLTIAEEPAHIGRQYSGLDDRYWNGLIDDVRIYYRALSEQEISGL
ncbi:MAG: discoidin domain-containing protein [Phycisphaeraceae bacterium]|nr:discoidin domain-containing protein [Phycisphaeraceae bacterium]